MFECQNSISIIVYFMQNGCQFHIKFHEKSKNELYFNLRSYPMKAEVKAEWNFEQSFIKRNKKNGNRYS